MSLRRTYYYIRHVQEASILSIMFTMFAKQILRTIILILFNKQTKQTINIFLIYRN